MYLQDVGWKGHELDLSGSVQGQVAGCCERGNEPSDSIKCQEFSRRILLRGVSKKYQQLELHKHSVSDRQYMDMKRYGMSLTRKVK
jgi:hypothetical protein